MFSRLGYFTIAATAVHLVAVAAAGITPATTRVDVGQNGAIFVPSFITAQVGDTIEFHFHPMNHSVVQGDFNKPCSVGAVQDGFNSGFVPSTGGEADRVFRILINSTSPTYFYCSTPKHCQAGMVGSINAPDAATLETYLSNAQNSNSSETPSAVQGGVLAANGAGGPSSSSTSAAASPTSSKNAAEAGFGSGGKRKVVGLAVAVIPWVL